MLLVKHHHKLESDSRGKITTGKKREGTDQGQALDYFNLDKFPELKQLYGEKPTSLLIVLPDEFPYVYKEAFERWGRSANARTERGSKISECDGETCRFRIPYTIGTRRIEPQTSMPCVCREMRLRFIPGYEDEYDELDQNEEIRRRACKYNMYLTAYVASPHDGKVQNFVPYCFRTSSLHSGASVRSVLEYMTQFTTARFGAPRITWMRFHLSVKMVEARDDPSKKFPIWQCRPAETMQQITNRVISMAETMGWDKPLLEAGSMVSEVVLPAPPALTATTEDEDDNDTTTQEDLWSTVLDRRGGSETHGGER
jgi:hypothetical protein